MLRVPSPPQRRGKFGAELGIFTAGPLALSTARITFCDTGMSIHVRNAARPHASRDPGYLRVGATNAFVGLGLHHEVTLLSDMLNQ